MNFILVSHIAKILYQNRKISDFGNKIIQKVSMFAYTPIVSAYKDYEAWKFLITPETDLYSPGITLTGGKELVYSLREYFLYLYLL